jgi:hypothetical protein
MKKLVLSAMVAAAALASVSAHAVQVSFNFTNTNVGGGDQSGKTSPFLTAANVATSNVFVETFSARNGGADANGCGLDTPGGLVSITGGTFGLAKGTLPSVYAAPAGDSTCFAYGPTAAGSLPDTVRLNYTGLLSTLGVGASLDYLGLYYGSIDTYNDLIFYNAAGQVINTITGASLIAQFNGQSGNQQSDSSNIYVNLAFAPGEQFTSFEFTTSGRAFEMDNVAVGFNATSVPEPASIALLGLGLAAIGVSRRKAKAKA